MIARELIAVARQKPPLALITASWVIYLLLLANGRFLEGALLPWLLFLVACVAVIVCFVSFTKDHWLWNVRIGFITVISWLLYAADWTPTVLRFTRGAGENVDLGGSLLYIVRIKVQFIGLLITDGRIWDGVVLGYWEFMPFLQAILFIYWIAWAWRMRSSRLKAPIA